jgi:predicted N-acetyltransferase YhbS
MTFLIIAERPDDAALNDPLLDRSFGFDRKQKTVYRLREGVDPVPELSFSAIDPDGGLLASLRFWPVSIGGAPGLLLGPLAVEPGLQGRGIGRSLVGHALAEARALGHRLCLVVGAPDYYRPFGFVNASGVGLILPGPVAPERFQVCELAPGALDGVHGVVGKTGASRGPAKSPAEGFAAAP